MGLRTKIAGLAALRAFDNWPSLCVNRALFQSQRVLSYKLGRLSFIVDHDGGDPSGTRDCFTSPMYKALLSKIDRNSCHKVLDLGANGGGFCLLLKHLGFAVESVTCVEMNPNTFSRLHYNIYSNFDCDIDCINAVMGGGGKRIELCFGRGSTSDSLLTASTDSDGKKRYFVDGLTFDELWERRFNHDERVDLCKIDIEGGEYNLILGGRPRFLSNCNNLVIEVHEPEVAADKGRLMEYLMSCGFVLNSTAPGMEVFLLTRR